ncbi:hypothetical protein EG68_00879 [Paragonimus skrjabini miyazakii]|uniref:Ras-GAP domain-containing protein n=1 Tax=Paragonimus skrjabini miyazakii TaxID=59628 RepID=A0A8S9Z9F8_9TREM|nr:hypothetical protein EG68_00879 [Paragonimus skrjabini miyazakii]
MTGCFGRSVKAAEPSPRSRKRFKRVAEDSVRAMFGCARSGLESVYGDSGLSSECFSNEDSSCNSELDYEHHVSVLKPILDYRYTPPLMRSLFILKRLVRPTRDQERRRENCLHVWIQEAKGLSGRHRYHCEILLDGKPCARTTSKRLTDMLFWGEEFDLSGLPDFDTLSVELWLDSDRSGSGGSPAGSHNRHRALSSPHVPTTHRQSPGSPMSTRRTMIMACARGSDGSQANDGDGDNYDDQPMWSVGDGVTKTLSDQTESNLYQPHSKTSSGGQKSFTGPVSRKAAVRRGKLKQRKRSVESSLVATVVIPKSNLSSTSELESWHPVIFPLSVRRSKRSDTIEASTNVGGSKTRSGKNQQHSIQNGGQATTVQLRIKTRYRNVTVLPLNSYTRLQHYLARFQVPSQLHRPITPDMEQPDSVLLLSSGLDPWLGVKAKAELAGSMVALHQALGQATDFLAVLILHEVYKQADPNMVLRGNSIATKATEIYLRLVGESYLCSVLSDFVRTVIFGTDRYSPTGQPSKTPKHARHAPGVTKDSFSFTDCEVDSAKLSSSAQLIQNQTNLLRLVQMVWDRILSSEPYFPQKLRLIFAAVRNHLDSVFPAYASSNDSSQTPQASLSEHVISACLFLRYICPAILSPSLFGLTSEFPSDPRVLRAFTLVAKTIQSLANFSVFAGAKEVYMTFMNQFVTEQLPAMRQFLCSVSSPLSTLPREPQTPGAGKLFVSHSHHDGFASTTFPHGNDKFSEQRVGRCDTSLMTRSTSGLPTTSISTTTAGNLSTCDPRMPTDFSVPDSTTVVHSDYTAPKSRRVREPIVLPSLPQSSVTISGDHIDLGLCLALCHLQLSEALTKVPTDKITPQEANLKPILEEIDFFLSSGIDPPPDWWHSSAVTTTTPARNISEPISTTSRTSVPCEPQPVNQACLHTGPTMVSTSRQSHRNGPLQLGLPEQYNQATANTVTDATMSHQVRMTSRGATVKEPVRPHVSICNPLELVDKNSHENQLSIKVGYTSVNPMTQVLMTNTQSRRGNSNSHIQSDVSSAEDNENVNPIRSNSPGAILPTSIVPTAVKVEHSNRSKSPLLHVGKHFAPQPDVPSPLYTTENKCSVEAYKSVKCPEPSGFQNAKIPSEESTLWSTDTESYTTFPPQRLLNSFQAEKQQIATTQTTKHQTIPTSGLILYATNSSSSGYQSLGSRDVNTYSMVSDLPVNGKNYARPDAPSFTSGTTTMAVSNPLYAVHNPHDIPTSPTTLKYSPILSTKQAINSQTPPVQAIPFRSKSFPNPVACRRHTYVNLTGDAIAEAMLSSIRTKGETNRKSSTSTSGRSRSSSTCSRTSDNEIDRCSIVGTGDEHNIQSEGSQIRPASEGRTVFSSTTKSHTPTIRSEGKHSMFYQDEPTRQVTTLHAVLEGFDVRPPYMGSDSVRSAGYLMPKRTALLPSNEVSKFTFTEPTSIRDELDASHARLVDAQARLLANEAERIQLLRTWHNELMRQSQLVNQRGLPPDGSTTRTPPPLTEAHQSHQRIHVRPPSPSEFHPEAITSSAILQSKSVGLTTPTHSASKALRPIHNTQPRMGASVISNTFTDPIVNQNESTLPRVRMLPGRQPTIPWTYDRERNPAAIVRSPSSPGLIGGALAHASVTLQPVELNQQMLMPSTPVASNWFQSPISGEASIYVRRQSD